MSKSTIRVLARSLLLLLTAALVAGCLFHTKDEADDGGVIGGGTLELEGFPVEAEGIDPAPAGDSGSTSNIDDWCQLLIDCICENLPSETYDDCVDLADESTDEECQAMIEDYYEECLED